MEPYDPELTAGPLPDGLTAVKSGNTYDISAEKSCTLDLHIQRLRKKLGWQDHIETVYKVGYRLKREEETP